MTPDRPTLLVFPFDLLSHYLRCLQLADAIRDVCDVRFARSDRYDTHVERAGFQTFDCASFDAVEVMASARSFDFAWLREDTIRCVYEAQVRCIRETGAAVVLGDTAPTLRMAAEQTGVTHLSLMNGYLTRHYALTRPIATAHPAARFADKVPPEIFDWMTRLGEGIAFRQVHRPFRRIRRQQDLAATRSYLDELEGHINLICDVEEMFPQKDLPSSYTVLGALYHASDEPEPEVTAFLDNGRPTLLASVGSSGDPARLSFLGAPEFSDCNILVAGAEVPGLAGDHILTRPFLNTSAILDAIDLVICHGGNGSVVQALSRGIPVVCLTNIFEQEWNARRVEALGVGCWLGPDAGEKASREAVRHWLGRKGSEPLATLAEHIDVTKTRERFRNIVLKLKSVQQVNR